MLGPRFIGRYKVIEEIGRGGMGIVYRGEDPRLERTVAIKVLPPRKTSSQKALERFKREARVCARLDHPYILKVYDYGEEEQTYHLVMEFVEGVTLRDIIDDEGTHPADIDIPEMARLFGQICQALEYAHALQITHRDIKPENIMVTAGSGPHGAKVKVMDFGLAVLESRHSLTVDGAVMGTIAYLSPEQAKGERADHRSDIYSLGAVFFEMLTGYLPFDATNAAEMLRQHIEAPAPTPRTHNPAVHSVLERVVLTCMRKDPADRYQNVRQIREELEAYRNACQISADYFWGSGGIISGLDLAASQRPPGRETEIPEEPDIQVRGARMPARGDFGRPPEPARPDPFPGPEMRNWRESDEALPDGNSPSMGGSPPVTPQRPLEIPPLASPMTPGMPPEIASKLGPPRATPAFGQGSAEPPNPRLIPQLNVSGPTQTPPAQIKPVIGAGHDLAGPHETVSDAAAKRPDSGLTMRSATPPPPAETARRVPSAGVNPIASQEWMKEAKDGPDPWGKYQNVLSRLRRDEDVVGGQEAQEIPSALCKACGQENPADRKYCHECGSLLAPSVFQVAREAAAHNDMGVRHLREGRFNDAVYEFQQALLLDSQLGEAHKNLGRVWAQLGETVKAEEELRLAASLSPEDPEPFTELAQLYRQLGRKGEAMQALGDALRMRPEDTAVRCQLAFMILHGGNMVRAVEEYRTVLAYDVENLEAHLQLGIIYGSQGMTAEAVAEFEWVVRLDPQNQRAWQWLGQLNTRRGRFSDAERAYQSALNINPADGDVHAELGSLYEIQRRDDAAITLDPGHLEAHSRLAALYLKYNQPAKAILQLQEVLAYHPQDATLHQQLGELYMAQNQLERALHHFEQTVALDPTSAEMHNRLGQLYLKKDYTALSIQEYQNALALDPYNPGFHEDLGMAYYLGGQRDLAINELKKAAILNSRNVEYPKALGIICEAEGRLEEAVQYLKRTLELAPRDADAHGLLGRIYCQQKMFNLAVLEFQKALEYNPENQLMYIYQAQAYRELGKLDVAISYFKQAISLMGGRGESPEARRALARSYQDLARTYLEGGDLRAAYEALESANTLAPDDARGKHYMALVLKAQGELKRALEFMADALKREPQNVDILADLASLYEVRGERDMAMKVLQKALKLNPNRAHLYELMAEILSSQGLTDEALAQVRQAMALDTRRSDHYRWVTGNYLMLQGKWQKAAGEYQHAQSVNPWNWKYYQGLARAFEEMGRYDEAAAEIEKALSLRISEKEARSLHDDLERLTSIRR